MNPHEYHILTFSLLTMKELATSNEGELNSVDSRNLEDCKRTLT